MIHAILETAYYPIINGQTYLNLDKIKYEHHGYEGFFVKAKCIGIEKTEMPSPPIKIKDGEFFYLNHFDRTILDQDKNVLASSCIVKQRS